MRRRLWIAQATGRPASECAAALAEMGIEEAPALSRRLPHEISTGQAQRVLLAAALLRAPRLIVADEPSASLDGGSFAELVRWLRRLCEQSGTALLLATHDRRLLGELQAEVFACRDGVFEPGPTDATPWPVRPRGDGAEGAPVLAARGLGVRLGGRQVLQDIDLEIRRGEVVALLGESGSGKTTLARVLCGHRRPDAGGVQAPARKTAVQLLFQDALASMTPGRSLGGLLRETSGPGFDAAATAARLGLRDGQLQRTVAELSGGERRRAALLRALSVDPELLALDEPTVSLDRRAAVAVMATTFEVQRQRGLSLLLITHDEELAAASADRVLRLQGGRLCS
jgi:peptide/nickel transport system ATP-binding protein